MHLEENFNVEMTRGILLSLQGAKEVAENQLQQMQQNLLNLSHRDSDKENNPGLANISESLKAIKAKLNFLNAEIQEHEREVDPMGWTGTQHN